MRLFDPDDPERSIANISELCESLELDMSLTNALTVERELTAMKYLVGNAKFDELPYFVRCLRLATRIIETKMEKKTV